MNLHLSKTVLTSIRVSYKTAVLDSITCNKMYVPNKLRLSSVWSRNKVQSSVINVLHPTIPVHVVFLFLFLYLFCLLLHITDSQSCNSTSYSLWIGWVIFLLCIYQTLWCIPCHMLTLQPRMSQCNSFTHFSRSPPLRPNPSRSALRGHPKAFCSGCSDPADCWSGQTTGWFQVRIPILNCTQPVEHWFNDIPNIYASLSVSEVWVKSVIKHAR